MSTRSENERRRAERVRATALQARALADATRLRILRLCLDEELTNRELADRLDRDPSTVLHHTRLLVETGLLEPAAERPGPRGSTEKPYRATGLSWRLDLGALQSDQGDLAALEAVREELRDAGPEAVRRWTRLALHLDDDDLDALLERLAAVFDEYLEDDDARRDAGAARISLYMLAHGVDPAAPGEGAGRTSGP